jgi:hypothetical protein
MLRQLVNPAIVEAYSEVHHGIVSAVIESIMIRLEVQTIVLQDFLQGVMIVIVFRIPAGIKRDLIIDSRSPQGNMQATLVPHVIPIPETSAYLPVQPAMSAEKWMTNMMMLEDIAMIPTHVLPVIPTGEKTISSFIANCTIVNCRFYARLDYAWYRHILYFGGKSCCIAFLMQSIK